MADPPPVLQVLHVEDEPNDRELVAATLRAAGMACEIESVDTRRSCAGAST
jgi:CheY-like chemotaxis protein